jgi:serine/threonine-protein kinase
MLVCSACGAFYRDTQRTCPRDGQTLSLAADVDWRIGSQVGNYRLVDVLGRGGMGMIYKAEHVYLNKPAAIKILHERAAADAANRLLDEARAAATIGHANIIDVSDFGETPDGLFYIVMELVQGRSLDEVLAAEGQLTLLRAINIINQVGRGLGAAHAKGIVHRDLKPANVMLQERPGRREIVRRIEAELAGEQERFEVRRESSYDFVTILDFGIAQFLDRSLITKAADDLMLGTPHYMAPEIVRGEEIDFRVDIYALGVMFYEMLTGTVPFDDETAREVLVAQCERLVPPMRFKNPRAQVTEAAERLIMRSMSKDPAGRPQSMDEFLHELQRCYGDENFLRNVEEQMPAAVAAGIRPRPKRLTEELSELFAKGDGSQILELALADPPPPKRD